MAVAVWARQTSSGGLTVTSTFKLKSETKVRRIAVLQDGAERGHATRTNRNHEVAARKARCGGDSPGNDPDLT